MCFSSFVSLLAKAEKAGVGRGQSGPWTLTLWSLQEGLFSAEPCTLAGPLEALSHPPQRLLQLLVSPPMELEAGNASSFGGWVKSSHGAG